MSIIAFSKTIGPVRLNCFLTEKETSNLEITENPVESGASVTDHSYLAPKQVTLELADENAAETYNALLAFQKARIPFPLVTGLTVHRNMLIKSISTTRDRIHSRVLQATVDLQEVIIVRSAAAAIDGQNTGDIPAGEPGGANSTRSGALTPESAGDTVTADRATGTVQRGDSPLTAVDLPGDGDSVLISAALFPG